MVDRGPQKCTLRLQFLETVFIYCMVVSPFGQDCEGQVTAGEGQVSFFRRVAVWVFIGVEAVGSPPALLYKQRTSMAEGCFAINTYIRTC